MQTYEYLCNHCHHFVKTEGPWPYRKEGKQRRTLDTPPGTAPGPIDGLMALVYCPTCDKNRLYPIVEYKSPLFSLDEIWWSDGPRKTRTLCYRCKSPVYLVLPPGSVKCPRCRKGTFEGLEPFPEARAGLSPVPPPRSPLRIRQDGRSIQVPRPVVVIDSAEHKGYTFERFSNWFSGTMRKRLAMGDYSLLGMESEVAIERKTVSDLVKSIIHERAGFIDKCEKLSSFRKKCLVIEGTLSEVKTPYEETSAHPNAVLGSLLAAQERWEIPIHFLDNFLLAEEFVASMLSKYHAYRWLETNGYRRCLIDGDI